MLGRMGLGDNVMKGSEIQRELLFWDLLIMDLHYPNKQI